MNPGIISHRMFVAALAHEAHAADKPPTAGPRGRPAGPGKLPPAGRSKALATLADRPWLNWPFGGWEQRPAS
jgi:hypothetical protein